MSECSCGKDKTTLLWSCSGGADVAEISDKAARKLSKESFGSMSCLAGIGAGISGFIESAKGADENITIDGCPIACARKNLEKIGVNPKSFVVTEMGFKKFATDVNDETVEKVCSAIRSGSNKKTLDNASELSDKCSCGGNCWKEWK